MHQSRTHSHSLIARTDAERAKVQNFYLPAVRRYHLRQAVNDMAYNFALRFRNKIQLGHKRGKLSQFVHQQMLSVAGGVIHISPERLSCQLLYNTVIRRYFIPDTDI